jgi:cytochrome P450
MARAHALHDVDLTDLDLFSHGFPHAVFEVHRRDAPVYWHEPTDHTPDREGFWSVATYPETVGLLRDPATFSSEKGGHRPYGGTILPDTTAAGSMLNMMDDPRHQRIRRLVNRGFTPRTIVDLEEQLRRRTAECLDAALEAGVCDFLVDVALEVPLQAVCLLLGAPEEDRHRIFQWIEPTLDFEGRDAYEPTPASREASARMAEYGAALIEEKRRNPGSDMLSVVTHAELDDEDPPRLTDFELLMFFFLLFAAGAETTRNASAGGLLALLDFPDELELVRTDPTVLPTAVDEIVRYTSPTAYNRRTATVDTELGGHPIRAGDKVVFWEASANRDEAVFDDPMRLDVRRDPNPHVGFGHGAHFCLGANLARLEIRLVLEELFARCSGYELAGEPEWQRSNKHTGLRHLPLRLIPR